jgi:hypothetical protein
MSCIHKELRIDVSAEAAWAAVRDVGAPHRRLTPGLLLDTALEPGARSVRFANGLVARERFVALDDRLRRFAYSAAPGGLAEHHNASMQVFDDGPGRCRLVWITDVLPDTLAGTIGALVEQGAALIKQTLEQQTAAG